LTAAESLAKQLGYADDVRPLQLLGEAGYLWLYMGRWQEASDVFEALTKLVPADPIGHLGLAEVHLWRGELQQATKRADTALKAAVDRLANDADKTSAGMARIIGAQAMIQSGQVDQARAALKEAAELDPTGPAGHAAMQMLAGAELYAPTTTGRKRRDEHHDRKESRP